MRRLLAFRLWQVSMCVRIALTLRPNPEERLTCDTSRVALVLVRTRLMATRYPYYLLVDSPEGIKKEAELTADARLLTERGSPTGSAARRPGARLADRERGSPTGLGYF